MSQFKTIKLLQADSGLGLFASFILINICAVIIFLLSASQAQAVQQQVQLPDGLLVNAEYVEGDKSKPAILVLHGFLQTYEFSSTRNIVNGLATLDYTVLAPNLSLGVPNRRQSAQCTAAHAHTMDGDIQEVAFWIDWLKNKNYKSVILVGHSWGSQYALAYLELEPDPVIKGIIAISLVRNHQTPGQTDINIKNAEQRIANKDKALHSYALSFCKEYMSTPQGYLSYAKWDDQRVTTILHKLKAKDVPLYTIIGDKDTRIDAHWIKLMETHTSLTVIEGANHFFSHMHEFELNDRLEVILEDIVK